LNDHRRDENRRPGAISAPWDDSPAPGGLPRSLDIEISSDGTTCTTVLSLTAAPVSRMTNAGVLTIPLNSVATRDLKMADTGSAGN
jgi:hypothetical protein